MMSVNAQTIVETYDLPPNARWNVNGRGDVVHIFDGEMVMKTVDGRTLKQSLKFLGDIEQFEVVNSLKYLVFSFEQQMICFFDNSLSNMDDCIDLDELGFNQVTKVTISSQSDKLWIYDDINSVLSLFSMATQLQSQSVQNLKGMLNIKEVSGIVEYNNRLMVIDRTSGIYIFDQYGTFLQFLPIDNVTHLEVLDKHILILQNQEMFEAKIHLDGSVEKISLGLDNVKEFHFNGESLFVQRGNKIEKYRF